MVEAVGREDLLEDIRAAARETGGRPTLAEYEEHGEHSREPVYRLFDSWGDALGAAGVEEGPDDVPTEGELRRLYHEEGMTLEEVGDELGLHHSTVGHHMRKHGVERREPSESRADHRLTDEDWLRDMLETDLTYEEIAEEAGAGGESAVPYWIREHGLEGRGGSKHPGEEAVRGAYVDDGLTIEGLADRFGVTTSTAWRWTEEAGIEKRKRGWRHRTGEHAGAAQNPDGAPEAEGEAQEAGGDDDGLKFVEFPGGEDPAGAEDEGPSAEPPDDEGCAGDVGEGAAERDTPGPLEDAEIPEWPLVEPRTDDAPVRSDPLEDAELPEWPPAEPEKEPGGGEGTGSEYADMFIEMTGEEEIEL